MLLTFRPEDIDTFTAEDRCEMWAAIRNKLGGYARDHGFPFVAVWARETRKDGSGEHFHMLMHVPPRHRTHFESILNKWLDGPGEVDLRPATYDIRLRDNGKQWSAVGYITKQMTPQASFKSRWSRQPGGPVLGKRGGCTTNIGRRARKAWFDRTFHIGRGWRAEVEWRTGSLL